MWYFLVPMKLIDFKDKLSYKLYFKQTTFEWLKCESFKTFACLRYAYKGKLG